MKKIKVVFLSFLLLSLLGCSSQNDVIGCYKVENDVDESVVVFRGGEYPTITISDNTGQDPLTTLGRIEDGAFIYADGTKFFFDEDKAWSDDGILAGISAYRVECDL